MCMACVGFGVHARRMHACVPPPPGARVTRVYLLTLRGWGLAVQVNRGSSFPQGLVGSCGPGPLLCTQIRTSSEADHTVGV